MPHILKEDIFQDLLDFLPEVIFVVNRDRIIEWVNEYGCKKFGYTLEEIKGKHLSDFIEKSFIKPMEVRAYNVIEKGRMLPRQMVKFVKKDGTIFWGLIHSKQLCNKDGVPIGAVGSVQDLTKYIELEHIAYKKKELSGLKYLVRNFE
jgi:two-component system sporulation sensor kinase C